ncbi:hypothetical protein EW145_g8137, partial [Phellinidium pouzarii]
MPQIPFIISDGDPRDPLRVLITGFGPFASYTVNPSWLAVKKLNNVVLETEGAVPVTVNQPEVLSDAASKKSQRPIHITTIEIPVTYSAVLSTVPGLHARPPTLPTSTDLALTDDSAAPLPPADGYDLVLHVGAGARGDLHVEKLGHKLGYNMPDVDGKLAPVVAQCRDVDDSGEEDPAERFDHERIVDVGKGEGEEHVMRGFAEGYEAYNEELTTGIDVDELVKSLKESGVEHVQSSTNAGRYLCDFIYYGSLAEAQ